MDAGTDSGCGCGPSWGRSREADPFAAQVEMWGSWRGLQMQGEHAAPRQSTDGVQDLRRRWVFTPAAAANLLEAQARPGLDAGTTHGRSRKCSRRHGGALVNLARSTWSIARNARRKPGGAGHGTPVVWVPGPSHGPEFVRHGIEVN